jgi:5-oxoprolinase (ATP-hydrolysing)
VIRFLSPLRVSLLTQRRLVGPPGLNGGMSGAPGEQFVTRTSGGVERLAPIDGFQAQPGDVLTIRTPGGGGYGLPKD